MVHPTFVHVISCDMLLAAMIRRFFLVALPIVVLTSCDLDVDDQSAGNG